MNFCQQVFIGDCFLGNLVLPYCPKSKGLVGRVCCKWDCNPAVAAFDLLKKNFIVKYVIPSLTTRSNFSPT